MEPQEERPEPQGQPGEPEALEHWCAEYCLIGTPWGVRPVSPVMAQHIERALTRWPRPRWISFVDITGARVRLRTALVECVEQSSPETRALWRRFRRETRREDESEGWKQ